MPRKSAAQKRKNDLLDEEDEVDVNAEWTVNENYAKRFTHNKQREDLHRLQELKKKGMAGSDSDDSESEDEDEDGKLPAKTDFQIFETLAMIKKKDPTIYKPEAKFYDDEEDEEEKEENTVDAKKKKPLYLKDVQARHLLDGDDDEEEEFPKKKQPKVMTYADEQEELKHSFLRSVEEADDSDDDLLRVRHRTNEELAKDEEETAEAVQEAERRKKDQDISKKLEDYFGKKDDDLDANEKFLKEFFLNEGWIDKERNRLPSYRDIVGEVSEDEAHLEDQDKYEAEYNFRFQENAGAQVMGNPRVVDGIVRKKGEVRKTQRQKKAERLAEEKKAREEDLKRLKNLKKKEIVEKLEKIKTVAGASAGLASLVEDDLEEDFDPLEYDRKMQEAFGESYYQEEDAEIGNEVDDEEGIIEKPNFDEEDEELGLPKDWDKKAGGFAAAHKTQKVSFKDKIAVDKNLEEYYKLDYEDMIGDLPTRFKYRGVKPNTFGLDVADILTADDKELNQHVSIKKLAPYRGEEWEAPKYSVLSQKARKKQALQDGPSRAPRKFSKGKRDEKKKEGKNKDKAPAGETNVKEEINEVQNVDSLEAEGEKKSKKRKRKMKKKEGPLSSLTPSRVEAYGALPTPEKKKKKKKKSVAG